jgi:hypothetical protein
MTVNFDFGHYAGSLTGSNIVLYAGHGKPAYEGPIDKLQNVASDAFNMLWKAGYIKRVARQQINYNERQYNTLAHIYGGDSDN